MSDNFKTSGHHNSGKTFLHCLLVKRISEERFNSHDCRSSIVSLMPAVQWKKQIDVISAWRAHMKRATTECKVVIHQVELFTSEKNFFMRLSRKNGMKIFIRVANDGNTSLFDDSCFFLRDVRQGRTSKFRVIESDVRYHCHIGVHNIRCIPSPQHSNFNNSNFNRIIREPTKSCRCHDLEIRRTNT